MPVNAAGGTGDERRQRLRDQMKAFYGDPNASAKRAASQGAAQGNPHIPPELDLDSEHFNVNRYTTDLLKRESLKGLVETDTDLLRRVRKLDGELQELVYRNYARFISATDTIREMKDNVVEMDAKLQTLSLNVSTIDDVSSQISQQLQVHRSHIEATITANRMLKKVQFLTSLPTTMRRLIDKEEFNVGVKYWVAGDGFLTKHKSIASITQIQQSCCQLAGELYRAIEQRMCSYPLDDPDAMDRIRSYVEDLRLLRATSLFESEHMADQPPFEEAVLRTLMRSVTASFQVNVATTQRSLKAALVIPEDIAEMELAKREASLSQVNLREPLAQLKNACAMLAVNSERVYALLDASTSDAEASSAAAQVAKDIQPVLMDMLPSLAQSLADFTLAHLDAIAMDGGSAMRNPAASAEALQSATTRLAKLLKQFVTAMTTLAEIYLSPLVPASTTASGAAAAAAGSPVSNDNAVQRYIGVVHDAARGVLQQGYQRMKEKVLQLPDAATLKACVPLPVANTSVVSAMPPMDDDHAQKLAFVLTRFLYASLSQSTANALRGILLGEDGLPMEVLAETLVGFERVAQQLQHRAIILLGQLEVQSIYTAAFGGASSEESGLTRDACAAAAAAAAVGAASTSTPAVQTTLLQLLPEWSTVYDTVKVLPTVAAAAAASYRHYSSSVAGGRGSTVPVGSPVLRRRETTGITGTTTTTGGGGAGSGYRVAYGGGLGRGSSSNAAYSDHRGTGTNTGGGGSSHLKLSGKLAVAYTRQVMSALQLSVNNIFANTEVALRTEPVAGPPSLIMACVVRYVLQGIVDRVRDEEAYSAAQFQRLQVSCTFLLHALHAPAKGTAPRQWRKEWSAEDMAAVQRLLDEACACAYEKYEAKVPLSAAVLETVVEAAVRGGRASLMAGTASPNSADTAAAMVRAMPTVQSPHDGDDAALSIPPALQRTSAKTEAAGAPSPVRHDDPLQTPQQSSASAPSPTFSASTSRSSSQPMSPAAPPVTAAPPAVVRAGMPTAPPAAAQPSSATTAPPPASAAAGAAASVSPRPKPSSSTPPAKPAASTGAQYYGAPQTERVARVDEEEELPL
ncbi:hypothetical protein ABB37_06324 [Leptomonas pyrrhocoris]|uniref:Uncharacterized protein n=1 Tax=Leptomonas pyrrhocoris TaxID=157538 RepID=A0A0M9FXU2_LEPPY|nr:hypothetical protein ABB37_06324 [Leptomonas pyrrhocoris]KPA78147.1 hypothetical protein ABB37_06324 [Leptomonas pyrrhocoris]|eukprot:XP_015656586.1 hypothetical protein ABB37_06324 [Leptomonas pyrrhocoris]